MWVQNGSPELDAESQYKKIMAVSLILTVLMSTIVSLRYYVRAVMLRAIGADDWVILFGAVGLPPIRTLAHRFLIVPGI